MKSIALKLWAGMMGLVAVMLVLLWLFQIVFLNSFYTGMRINEIIKSSSVITEDLSKVTDIRNSMDKLALDNNLTIDLIDKDQNSVYSAGTVGMNGRGMIMMMMGDAMSEAITSALEGRNAKIQVTHPRLGSKYMLIGLPVYGSGVLQGALIITLPLAPVEDTANILQKQLLYISLILLCLTLVLSYLLSRSFSKPILDINNTAKALASGNLEARSRTGRKDEIGKLAETINYMGKELSKTDQLRKDLIANVSHELRTPLSLIKGYAETIRDVTGGNEEKRSRQLGIIIEESDRLENIVEDILNLSQMQAGYASLNIKEFCISEMLSVIVKRYEILGEKTGVGIILESPENKYAIGDEEKIAQVMYNLLNNAYNHSPEGSSITVRLLETGETLRLEVADSGEGIPEEELKNIWERFYKVDKSGKRRRAGTGLGLAIVKNILEAHKAGFGVNSKMGAGTVFWFELKKPENKNIVR